MAVLSRRQMKQDADFIFHELTRSICPECRSVIDAQIIIRDNRVYMRKRCPEHGWFEGLISSDAEMYVDSIKFNNLALSPWIQHPGEGWLPARLRPLVPSTSSTFTGP